MSGTLRIVRRVGFATATALALAIASVVGYRTLTAPPSSLLRPWHQAIADELPAATLATTTWSDYLTHEKRLLDTVDQAIAESIESADEHVANRYAAMSPMHRVRLARDWNRSYELQPVGDTRGIVVLLHGLTDSPYRLRHLASHYQARGFLALSPRLPGHGTVPGALTQVQWQQWLAVAKIAMREAHVRNTKDLPLHLVGYSNGAALALMVSLDAIEDTTLPRPDRIVLLSPMIGVGELGRFAGVLGWPAALPSFAGAAWIDVLPEYNPFKYNSFPVNAARQSSLLTRELDSRLLLVGSEQLAPILAIQSLADDTVSTAAVIAMFERLNARHELVLIDIDRSALVDGLLYNHLLPAEDLLGNGDYRAAVLSNRGRTDGTLVERRRSASIWTEHATTLRYPFGVYSLSHIALPFPCDDPLYGLSPRSDEGFGIALGALAVRGERGLLRVSQDDLTRMKCNPFFSDVLARIDHSL